MTPCKRLVLTGKIHLPKALSVFVMLWLNRKKTCKVLKKIGS
jgi:hypothetical protein